MTTAHTGAVLVTGATGGLGRRIVERLAAASTDVVVGGRRADAVVRVVESIDSRSGGRAHPFVADLADLDDVRRALDTADLPPLRGIVTNAGISTITDATSAQGLDLTFAVNVLSHQLILLRLAPGLLPGGRIVVVSSGVHDPDNKLARRARVPTPVWVGARHLADQANAPASARLADGRLRYSTSKLANVLQARGLQRRLRDIGSDADVFALDPGLMVDTDLAREYPKPAQWVLRTLGRVATPFVANMRLSTTTAEYVRSMLLDDDWAGRGFAYVDGNQVQPPSDDALRDDYADDLWVTNSELLAVDPNTTALPLV